MLVSLGARRALFYLRLSPTGTVECPSRSQGIQGAISTPGPQTPERTRGKEIALELPEGAIDRLAATLDPIAEAYPVFKPVLDVLGSTLTDIAQARLKAKLDDLTGSVVKHPENVSWQILV